jgi:serine/threonine-protein kinase HipA
MARQPSHAPLNVYLNGRLIGRLRRESSGAIDFQYDQSWLDWENDIPVSVSLPLREDRYIGDPVLAVFENLLPDNDDIRRRLAERAKAKGPDPYNLLSAVGRDCVGALQFPTAWPPDRPVPSTPAWLPTRRSRKSSATSREVRSVSARIRSFGFACGSAGKNRPAVLGRQMACAARHDRDHAYSEAANRTASKWNRPVEQCRERALLP